MDIDQSDLDQYVNWDSDIISVEPVSKEPNYDRYIEFYQIAQKIIQSYQPKRDADGSLSINFIFRVMIVESWFLDDYSVLTSWSPKMHQLLPIKIQKMLVLLLNEITNQGSNNLDERIFNAANAYLQSIDKKVFFYEFINSLMLKVEQPFYIADTTE